jgi:DNA-binding LytR/AlgR family response regulator
VRVARLAEALRRGSATHPAAPAPPLRADDTVQVKTGPGAARFVRLADIVFIRSQDNYTELTLANGQRLLVRLTLAAWEARLPGTHFMRVHRRTIVSLTRIEGFAHADEEIVLLRLAGTREPVRGRRRYWSELRARLSALGVSL